MFRALLVNKIRCNVDETLQRGSIQDPLKVIPSGCTEGNNWDNLTPPQQLRKLVGGFIGKLAKLEVLDHMQMLSSEKGVTSQVQEIVLQLCKLDKPNATNPTRLELLEAVTRAVRDGKPIEMVASLCLEKGPGLREGKLGWYLSGQRAPTPSVLAEDACRKGWETVKRLLEIVKYPINVRFVIGDLDYAVVDGCREWCLGDWTATLNRDTDRIVKETQSRANAFFGEGHNVQVVKWSELYEAKEIEAELLRATTILGVADTTAPPKIVVDSIDMYKHQWGYAALARRLGISDDQVKAFIIGDVQRMAAQYRVEANYVRRLDGIQLWCEAVPKPSWPIELSNYDGAGYVACLIMD